MNLGVAIAGGGGKREKDDFYPTPPEATHALLPLISHWPRDVWEPCCGDGALSKILQGNGFAVCSSDLVDRGFGDTGLDFFDTDFPFAQTVITNPPFKDAARFIRHARSLGVSHLALLLKVSFWNARTRLGTWTDWTPSSVHPLMWRLDFTGAGAPTMDCMWCLWEPRDGPTTFQPLTRPS